MSSSGHHLGQTVANLLHLYYTYLGTIAVLSRDRMTIVEGMKNVASHVFYGSSLLTFPAGLLLLLLLFWLYRFPWQCSSTSTVLSKTCCPITWTRLFEQIQNYNKQQLI